MISLSSSSSSSTYASLQASQHGTPPCPSIPPTQLHPCQWPGNQNRDSLFALRDRLYAPLTLQERRDPWENPLHTVNTHIINKAIVKMGKNVCEYRVFPKTPVLWYD